MGFGSFLCEIADKQPTLDSLWTGIPTLIVVACIAGFLKPQFGAPIAVFAALWQVGSMGDVLDEQIGRHVVTELGWGYVVTSVTAPLTIVAAYLSVFEAVQYARLRKIRSARLNP